MTEYKFGESANDLIIVPLLDLGLTISDIHHVEVLYACPDKWFNIVHRKGDKKKSCFRKLFHLSEKTYDETIVYNPYMMKNCTVSDAIKSFDKDIYFINENDPEYPIWLYNGIQVYVKDKYGNAKKCSHAYYTNIHTIDEIEKIVFEINYKLYKDKFDLYNKNDE